MMEWKRIETPKKKSEYQYKFLRLKEDMPPTHMHMVDQFLARAGDVVKISRRLNAKDTMLTCDDISRWGNVRVLKIAWNCPTCHYPHHGFIPESWIKEGKAEFVEMADSNGQK